MRVLPAIDLREGACVQLVGGDFAQERVRLPNPLEVARNWRGHGFSVLHVVDLDAATGKGENRAVIQALCAEPGLEVQVGGGIREQSAAERVLSWGAKRVVVGTRAIEDAPWLESLTRQFPHQVVLAADVRGRQVVTRGWKSEAGLSVEQLLQRVNALPLAGVLVTAVHLEGQLRGTDVELFAEVAGVCSHPVIASGGVTLLADLRALKAVGIQQAVVGMALYTGEMNPTEVAKEFAQ